MHTPIYDETAWAHGFAPMPTHCDSCDEPITGPECPCWKEVA